MDVRGSFDFHKGGANIHCIEVRYLKPGKNGEWYHDDDIYIIQSSRWNKIDICDLTEEYDLPDYENCKIEVSECRGGFVSLNNSDENEVSGNNLIGVWVFDEDGELTSE